MGLSIENATVGYDRSGLTALIEAIRVDCIETTITAINSGMEELRTSIEQVWIGHSAEKYKQKLDEDKEKVTNAINTIGEQIAADLAAAITQIDNVDNSITF